MFQQTIDIPMVRIVLRYSPICFYTLMRQIFFKNKDRKLAQAINSGFYYIEDVLLLNNFRFGYYLHRIYRSFSERFQNIIIKLIVYGSVP